MASGKNFVEGPEAQPLHAAEESGGETEDEDGNTVGPVSRNHGKALLAAGETQDKDGNPVSWATRNGVGALGGVGGTNATTAVPENEVQGAGVTADNGAVSTAVSNPQSPVLGTSTNAVQPKVLFAPSLSQFNITGAPIDEDIAKETWLKLATAHYDATRAFNKLRDEQEQCLLAIDQCKVEKRKLELVAKEIDQRSDAATKRFKQTMDEMQKVRQEKNAAQDKFMKANEAIDGPKAGASKR